MATNKAPKKKFTHPDLLIEYSTSDESNDSNHRPTAEAPPNKKKKFWHPDMLMEYSTTDDSNDTINSNQDDQIGGQNFPPTASTEIISSPIAGPSNQVEPIPGPSRIQPLQPEKLTSPIPGTSKQTTEPIPGPSRIQETGAHQFTADDSGWYEEETKVFENEDFTVFIQKQDHQRQKVFRLEDHLFVMRIKLKNHKKPPLLRSVRDIIEQTMKVMVNDLKKHYNPQESNLIYVTIKQPGDCYSYKHNCECLDTQV